MAQVFPFCGLRYNNKKIKDIKTVLAPPYDVVNKEARDKFLLESKYNIFHLELPKEDKKNNRNRYENAAHFLNKWKKEGVIIRDESPKIYSYEIDFKIDNKNFSRKAIVALVRVEPWENRIIRPHEKTFDKVTTDRLHLLEHTKTQFSQVFLLYRGNQKATEILKEYNTNMLYEVEDPLGNTHKLSSISDLDCAKRLHEFFSSLPMYIADGHHRYTTALNFSRRMQEKFGSESWRAYNYIMVYMVDVNDPGLIVLPTHRIVTLSNQSEVIDVLDKSRGFFDTVTKKDIEDVNINSLKDIKAELSKLKEKTAFAVFYVKDNKISFEFWRLKETVLKELLKNIPEVLAKLDVTILNDIVFTRVVGLDMNKDSDLSKISFTPEESNLLNLKENQLFFMLNATDANEVLKVSDEGLVMPHKSTFFYPKILTGLVMNSVSENDKILL